MPEKTLSVKTLAKLKKFARLRHCQTISSSVDLMIEERAEIIEWLKGVRTLLSGKFMDLEGSALLAKINVFLEKEGFPWTE